jgi:hypothetical protein
MDTGADVTKKVQSNLRLPNLVFEFPEIVRALLVFLREQIEAHTVAHTPHFRIERRHGRPVPGFLRR